MRSQLSTVPGFFRHKRALIRIVTIVHKALLTFQSLALEPVAITMMTTTAGSVVQCDPRTTLAGTDLTIGWLVDTLLERNPEFKQALGSGKVVEVVPKNFPYNCDTSSSRSLPRTSAKARAMCRGSTRSLWRSPQQIPTSTRWC